MLMSAASLKPFARQFLVWLKERPLRRGLGLLLFLYLFSIFRFFVWPPVALLVVDNPDVTSFMEYRRDQWEDAGKKKEIQQTWVPLSRISPHLRRAVVLAEDGNFWEHSGFDMGGIRAAVERNFARGRFAAGARERFDI